MNSSSFRVPLSSILVEGRLREDLGDIEDLAESIKAHGLWHPLVVEKIDHPTFKYALRAGGRRYTACTLLKDNKVEGWDTVPVTVFDEMPPYQRVIVELDENLKRKSMTWQEVVRGIVRYHKACKRAAALEDEKWTQEKTGEMLGMNQAKVSIAFKVHEEMEAGNEKVLKAESLLEAVKAITSAGLDEAQAEQMRRLQVKREQMKAAQAAAATSEPAKPLVQLDSAALPDILRTAQVIQPDTVEDKIQFSKEQVAAMYIHGDALTALPELAKRTTINHIITDPPYGIDMDMLTRKDMGRFESIERIADTHNVEDNLKMLPEFLRVAFDAIAEDGFLCMWYDLDHHEKLAGWARKIGWKVQRWPLVWCKSSSCLNNAAQCNITKATEFCYFFRRSEKSIIKQKQAKNYIEAASCSTPSHPFPKPHAVWKYLLDTVSTPGQTVVDPFCGEGSFLAAAFKEGRSPLGIEVDDKHIASGLSYVQEQINRKSLLDDLLKPAL